MVIVAVQFRCFREWVWRESWWRVKMNSGYLGSLSEIPWWNEGVLQWNCLWIPSSNGNDWYCNVFERNSVNSYSCFFWHPSIFLMKQLQAKLQPAFSKHSYICDKNFACQCIQIYIGKLFGWKRLFNEGVSFAMVTCLCQKKIHYIEMKLNA